MLIVSPEICVNSFTRLGHPQRRSNITIRREMKDETEVSVTIEKIQYTTTTALLLLPRG